MSEELVNLTIDGKTVDVPKGMNLIEAAKRAGVQIPVFCYHPKLEPAGVCRMCLVQVEGIPKPVTACTMMCDRDMEVHTDTELVADLRRGVLEFLLINHPLDCPVCDKGGECDLQDLTFAYGPATSRLADGKIRKDKAVDLGNFIVLDNERCILCRRCTRFDDEVAKEGNLIVEERGNRNKIATADEESYDSYFSGNTIELCPVGALTSDLYRFRARPWDLSHVESVCSGCSVGCSVRLDFRHGELLRVISQDNPATDGGWICDKGRFNYRYVHADDRITTPLVRKNGELTEATWDEALDKIAAQFKGITRSQGGSALGFIGGGRLTNEEAYLYQKLARGIFGSNNVDHRVTDQHVASSKGFGGRQTDVDTADVLLDVDALVAETAPILDLRVRRAIEDGKGQLFSMGVAAPLYRGQHTHLPVGPGGSAAVLEAIAGLLAENAADHEELDIDVSTVAEAIKGGEKVVVLWSGDNAGIGQAIARFLNTVKKLGKTAVLLIPGDQTNTRGAEAMGCLPDLLPGHKPVTDEAARKAAAEAWQAEISADPGLSTRAMLKQAAAGKLQALYLVSANLTLTFPDADLVQRALDKVPFLVVQELFMTDAAKAADVVLPVAAFPAKSGSYTSLDGRVQGFETAMRPQGDVRPDGDIFDGLAQKVLGKALVSTAQEFQWELEHLAFGLEDGTYLPGAGDDRLTLPDGDPGVTGDGDMVVAAIDKLYGGGSTTTHDPGFEHVQPEPFAVVNPADASRLGLSEGAAVVLTGAGGSIEVSVRIRHGVTPGVILVPRNLPEAPVNRLLKGGRYAPVAVNQKVLKEVS